MDYILSKVKHLLKVKLGAGSILVRAKGIQTYRSLNELRY